MCKADVTSGISLLHGNQLVFQNEVQPAFKSVYRTFAMVSTRVGDTYRLYCIDWRNTCFIT